MKELLAVISLIVSGALAEPPAPYAPSGWRPEGPAFELPQRGQAQQPSQYLPPTPLDPRNPGFPNENPEEDVSVQGLPVQEETPFFQRSPVNGQQNVGPTFKSDIQNLDQGFKQTQFQQQQQRYREFERQKQLDAQSKANRLPRPQIPVQFAPRTTTTTESSTTEATTQASTTEINLNEGETLEDPQPPKVAVEVAKQKIQEYPGELFLSSLAQLQLQPQFVPLQFGQLRAPVFVQGQSQKQVAGFDAQTHFAALPSILAQQRLQEQGFQSPALLVAGRPGVQPVTAYQPQPQLQAEPVEAVQPQVFYGQPSAEPQYQTANAFPQQPQLQTVPQFSAQPVIVQPQDTNQLQPAQYQPQQVGQFQPQTVQFQPEQVQYQPQTVQFQPEQVQYQPQGAQFQPQPAQFQPQAAYQPQTVQFQPQPAQFQPQPAQFQPQPAQFQPQPAQYQPQSNQENQDVETTDNGSNQPQLYQQPFLVQQPAAQYQPQFQAQPGFIQAQLINYPGQDLTQFQQQTQFPGQFQPQSQSPDALQSGLDVNQQGNDIEEQDQEEEGQDEGRTATAVATAFGARTQPRVVSQYGAPYPAPKVRTAPGSAPTTESAVEEVTEQGPVVAQAVAIADGNRKKSSKLRSRRVRPIFTLDRSGHLVLAQGQ
ncbi:chromatin modification-related protein eaf-1-like [Trichoplusia ni]|uniref:Chromatin modification-related protein eaf-1-like n=1 Tax=Trichoplusia ni TaxID=7111 RepID=A0A7E5X0N0_TRINI|nr:chromatin modification-related protein eaf-1-like [Trichoplusia ni]